MLLEINAKRIAERAIVRNLNDILNGPPIISILSLAKTTRPVVVWKVMDDDFDLLKTNSIKKITTKCIISFFYILY